MNLVGMSCLDLENPDSIMIEKATKAAWKEYLACLALSGANGMKFGNLKDKLKNESLFDHDN